MRAWSGAGRLVVLLHSLPLMLSGLPNSVSLPSLWLLPALCNTARAQDEASAPLDTRLLVEVGRPLLIEGDAQVRIEIGGQKVSITTEVALIDEHSSVQDPERCVRKYLRVHTDVNGESKDPPVNGLSVEFSSESGSSEMKALGDWRLPDKVLDNLLEEVPSLGLWLDFPDA